MPSYRTEQAVLERLRCAGKPGLCRGDLVLCDFDGTISLEDVGIAMINAVGDPKGWELEMMWRRGEIGSKECLAGQWALMNWPPEKLEAFLDTLPLDGGFTRLAELCRKRGAKLVVVSDGLDLYLFPMLRRLGINAVPPGEARSPDDVECYVNAASWRDGRVHVEFPYASDLCDLCANCKLEHLMRLRRHHRRVIYIGDGYSDRCPAKYADLVFAKAHLAEILEQERAPFIPFQRLDDVVSHLGQPCPHCTGGE